MSIHIHLGNIVELEVDAIVNAANNYLKSGGGVCGAIFEAAGIELEYECDQIQQCKTGSAVITKGYNLPAKFVIHAVGPIYDNDPQNAPSLLKSAYQRSLELAKENNLQSIAFPCISTGIFGYPQIEAAKIAISTAKSFLENNKINIIFCCYSETDFSIYESLLKSKKGLYDF